MYTKRCLSAANEHTDQAVRWHGAEQGCVRKCVASRSPQTLLHHPNTESSTHAMKLDESNLSALVFGLMARTPTSLHNVELLKDGTTDTGLWLQPARRRREHMKPSHHFKIKAR